MSTDSAARLLNEGWDLQQNGDFEKAIKKYEAVLRETSSESKIPILACLNIGNIAYERSAYDVALRWYSKAIEIDPLNDAPYFNIANVYRDLKNYPDAIANYKMAFERNPNDPDSHRNLAHVFMTLGKGPLAAEELEKCIKISQGADPRDYFNLGLVYYKTGHQVGAMVSLQKFIAASPAEKGEYVVEARRMLNELKAISGYPVEDKRRLIFKDGRVSFTDEDGE